MSSLPGSGRVFVLKCSENGQTPAVLCPVQQNQKPFQCGHCSVTFNFSFQLAAHIEAHSCIKPFQCGYCKVSYNSNSELKVHVETHKLFVFCTSASAAGNQSCPLNVVNNLKQDNSSVSQWNGTYAKNDSLNAGTQQVLKDNLKSAKSPETLRAGVSSEKGEDSQINEDETVSGASGQSVHTDGDTVLEMTVEQVVDDTVTGDDAGSDGDDTYVPDQSEQSSEHKSESDLVLSSTSGNALPANTLNNQIILEISTIADWAENSKKMLVPMSFEKSCSEALLQIAQKLKSEYPKAKKPETSKRSNNVPLPVAETTSSCDAETQPRNEAAKLNGPSLQKEQDNSLLVCGVCATIFNSSQCLLEHWESVHKTCDLCDASFSDPLKLHDHLVQTHGQNKSMDKPFLCGVCGADFHVAHYVADHIKWTHDTSDRQHQVRQSGCPLPGQAEISDDQGFMDQTGPPCFCCKYCDAHFNSLGNFIHHVSSLHTNPRDKGKRLISGETASVEDHHARDSIGQFIQPSCEDPLASNQDSQVEKYSAKETSASGFAGPASVCAVLKIQETLPFSSSSSISTTTCSVATVQAKGLGVQKLQEYLHQKSTTSADSKDILREGNEYHFLLYRCCHCSKEFASKIGLMAHRRNQHKNEKVFPCVHCSFEFKRNYQLIDHLNRVHNIEQPGEICANEHKCFHCEQSFTVQKDLMKHNKEEHGDERAFRCPHCSSAFKLNRQLTEHIMRVHNAEQSADFYQCSHCEHYFTSRRVFSKHNKLEHGDETAFRCSHCFSVFKHYHRLAEHVKRNHTSKQPDTRFYKCFHCEQSFTNKIAFMKHTKLKHGDKKMLSCFHCSATFEQPNELADHMKEVHKPRQPYENDEHFYKCFHCEQTFTSQKNFENHGKFEHGDERVFRCPHCSSAFKKHSYMVRHMKNLHTFNQSSGCTSSQESCEFESEITQNEPNAVHLASKVPSSESELSTRSFSALDDKAVASSSLSARSESLNTCVCHICGNCFSLSLIAKHLKTHVDARRFKCNVCSRAFKTKPCLTLHMRVHTKEKPYMCDICGKTFARLTYLTYHKHAHTNARPYKCKTCHKGFNCHMALTLHQRRHVGDRRYCCDVCGKQFYTLSSLKKHAVTHTDLRPSSCKQCGKTYRSSSTLYYHQTHVHPK